MKWLFEECKKTLENKTHKKHTQKTLKEYYNKNI